MKERLKEAEESFDEAALLYRERIGNKLVIAKLYHAVMYCLFALFNIRDIGKLSHLDIIERFEKEYVQKGIFDDKLLNIIRHAYDLTHECDCEHMPTPANGDIERAMHAVNEFIHRVDVYFKSIK